MCARQKQKVSKKCDNLQRVYFLPSASKHTEHNGLRILLIYNDAICDVMTSLPKVLQILKNQEGSYKCEKIYPRNSFQ